MPRKFAYLPIREPDKARTWARGMGYNRFIILYVGF